MWKDLLLPTEQDNCQPILRPTPLKYPDFSLRLQGNVDAGGSAFKTNKVQTAGGAVCAVNAKLKSLLPSKLTVSLLRKIKTKLPSIAVDSFELWEFKYFFSCLIQCI